MSEITKTKCDFCGREVRDLYAEEKWINTSGTIRISIGRDVDGSAHSARCGSPRDFCNMACFLAYLKQLVDQCDYEVIEIEDEEE